MIYVPHAGSFKVNPVAVAKEISDADDEE
jgi:hypothetical protein